MTLKARTVTFKTVFVAILSVVMAFGTVFQVFAAAAVSPDDRLSSLSTETVEKMADNAAGSQPTVGGFTPSFYVCEVTVATDQDHGRAAQKLRDAGYYVYDTDLKNGTDGECCLLGYKLTSDKSKAITSLYVMDMDGGYDLSFKYRDFLKGKLPGLPEIITGLQESCARVRELVNAHNPIAEIALKTLNLLCVPKSSGEKTGTPLGDYLIMENRTYSDLETLILVCDTDTVAFINNLLATGSSACYDNPDADSFDGWESNPNWLANVAAATNEALIGLQSGADWENRVAQYEKDNFFIAESLRSYMKEKLTEEGKKCLQNTPAGFAYGDDEYYSSVYDLLTSKHIAPLASFAAALPTGVTVDNFVKVVSRFAADPQKRIPTRLSVLPDVVSPWMKKTVDYLNSLEYDPFTDDGSHAITEKFGNVVNEIELMDSIVDDFIKDYRDQRNMFDEYIMNADISGSMSDVVEKYSKDIEEYNATVSDSEQLKSDLMFYVGAYETLEQYMISDGSLFYKACEKATGKKCENLAQYFEIIADAEENTKKALACTLMSVLSKGELYNLKTTGLPIFIINGNISPSMKDALEKQYEENRKNLIDAFAEDGLGPNECSVWHGTNKDLLETENLAMTSAAVRAKNASNEFVKSFESTQRQLYKKNVKIPKLMKDIGLAMAVIGTATTICSAVCSMAIGGTVGMVALVQLGLYSTMGCAAAWGLGIAGACAAIIGAATVIATVVITIVLIVLLILSFTYDVSDEDVKYTEIPTIMMDCMTNINKDIVRACRYDVVRDVTTKKPADLSLHEETKARKWIALYYSYDTGAGSPLVANESDICFATRTDTTEKPEKSVAVSKFGYTTPYSMNSNIAKADTQLYLYYYTENSINGIEDSRTPGKYIYDLKISVAKTYDLAKSYITSLAGYNFFETNLTPNSKYYTFIGYSTTNAAKEAITDIRAAYGTNSDAINWGGAVYQSLFAKGQTRCPLETVAVKDEKGETTQFYYQLYVSKSSLVGDPILASSLSVADDISKIWDGCEYIRWFSGGAFDFNGTMNDSKKSFEQHRFLMFAPEEKYRVSGEKKYLAGIAFFTGSEDWLGSSDTRECTLGEFAGALGYTVLPIDVTAGSLYDAEDKTYLAYSCTANPKKAITDIVTFTGEMKGSGYLTDNITRAGTSYESAQVFVQADSGYFGKNGGGSKRTLRVSHAYVTKLVNEADMFKNGDWKNAEYSVNPRGLYTSGPVSGKSPILLSDVVYTRRYGTVPTAEGINSEVYLLTTGAKAMKPLGSGWISVHAAEQMFYDEYSSDGDILYTGTNLGVSRDEKAGRDCVLYLFFKNGSKNLTRGKYIRTIEISGSISENSAYDEARYIAMSLGEEIVNLTNPLYTSAGMRYDVTDETVVYEKGTRSDDYESKCYYLTVSYQNSTVKAVASVRIDRQDGRYELPETKKMAYDATGVQVSFNKCSSYAPTRPKEDDSKTDEGYVLYVASHSGCMSRVTVADSASISGNTGVSAGSEVRRDFARNMSGGVFVSSTGQCILLSGLSTMKYVSGITFITGCSSAYTEFELIERGFSEIIRADALCGTTGNPVYIGITRTSSSLNSLKDIKILHEDKGATTVINDREYIRANARSLSYSPDMKNAEPIFVYTTTGNKYDINKYRERTSITNIGLYFTMGDKKTKKTYWNGMVEADAKPKMFDEYTKALSVSDAKGKKAYLNKAFYDDALGKINITARAGSEELRQFKIKHGYSELVYTTTSNYTLENYSSLFKQGVLTGTAAGDAKKLGTGSLLSGSPILVSVISVCAGAMASGIILLIFVRKKKQIKHI